jgi:hypothetical protein
VTRDARHLSQVNVRVVEVMQTVVDGHGINGLTCVREVLHIGGGHLVTAGYLAGDGTDRGRVIRVLRSRRSLSVSPLAVDSLAG